MKTLLAFAFVATALVAAAAGTVVTPVRVVPLPDGGIQPQAVADASGVIHVLYFTGDPAHGDLNYAKLGTNDTLSAPIRVNTTAGSVIAKGTVRGGHLALGRNGRVHVVWQGSDRAQPRAAGNATPVLYTRLNKAGTAFEPERNIVSQTLAGLDGGTVAADRAGFVYVVWHAFKPGQRAEEDRRVWVARSRDDGTTFEKETAASPPEAGGCDCCGAAAFADSHGSVYVLYRGAREVTHRDTYLLRSNDLSATFKAEVLQPWNIGACPMSSFSFAESPSGVLAAWETAGQVQWLRVSPDGKRSPIVGASGDGKNRKHPAVAANAAGETILVWTESTGWNRGGALVWQLFDAAGHPAPSIQHTPGIPVWGLATVVARPDGSFVILR